MESGRVFTYKLVLLGETAVGKSSLCMRFVRDVFNEYQESTIGAAYFTQTVPVDGDVIKFNVWDTAGQERYHSLAPMYYRGAKAGVVVYDITSMDSFERAKAWVTELQREGSLNMVIALAGNKLDLEHSRQVPTEVARSYAAEQGIFFMETSAKTAMNVAELFSMIAVNLPRPKTTGGVDVDAMGGGGGHRLSKGEGGSRGDGSGGRGGGCCS
mmetsp:Transcript_11910/g.38100  ORF Transcript_11910/g.38100 Transcript_11910/m.38100 type:complete len:213 (-) Transcript_11910:42-680(-)